MSIKTEAFDTHRTKRLAAALVAAVALVLVPTAEPTYARNTVPCWHWNGSTFKVVPKYKPRKCTLGGRFGYQQVDLIRMRWRSWRGASAYGHGISVANSNVRMRVRVKVYRPVRWRRNTTRFTRARIKSRGRGWGPPLVLRIR